MEAAPSAVVVHKGAGIEGGGIDVCMPPKYVLRRGHVEDVLKGVPEDMGDVTVWIHSSTHGIEKGCFEWMKRVRVSRILVWGPEDHDDGTPPHAVEAATLHLFIARLRAYEPDLVDLIYGFATHNKDEMHRVGEFAFRCCSALKEVVLPRSITHVGGHAFHNCTLLTSVTLPNALTHIGEYAFHSCTSLTSVTLPDTLTRIGEKAFHGCSSLTSVTLPPNSLTHVGKCAFYGCTSLTSATLLYSLTHVGDCMFSGCTSLTSVALPNSLTHLGKGAFAACTSLTSVTLPDSLTHIGNWAFSECTSLT
jgi:hypothetical protein